MNDDQWANVFGNNNPGGESAAVGLDSPAQPISVSQNAQSDSDTSIVYTRISEISVPSELNFAATENANRVTPDQTGGNFATPKKRGRPANSEKLQRAVVYLPPGLLAALPADRSTAEHVRAALAQYLTPPTPAHQHTAPDPLSVRLSPNAHALAVQVAGKLRADVGALVSAAVMEQLEVMR